MPNRIKCPECGNDTRTEYHSMNQKTIQYIVKVCQCGWRSKAQYVPGGN